MEPTPRHDATGLRKNAIGMWTIVFFVIAAAAPLTAMLGAVPVAIAAGNGAGVPGAYVAAGLVLLLFSVGYAAMSRHVTNAGAFYAYIASGLGRPMGLGGAAVAILAYNAIQLALYGLFGFFANMLVAERFGLNLPWWLYSLIAMGAVLLLGVRRIELNGRVLGLFMLLEIGILLILDVAIVAKGGPQGLTLTSFAPEVVFSGAFGIALMFAIASFVGFEATALYGEEARDPKRTVARATYTAVLVILVFYAFTSWAIVQAYGPANVAAAAAADPGNFWFVMNTKYVGALFTDIMSVLLVTSIFASILAFHNAITRYLYALGREGLLWTRLGHTHPTHCSPHVAAVVQTVTVAVVVALFALFQQDPYVIVFSYMSALATLGILALQFAVSIAVIGFFRRTRADTRPWHTLVAPALGAVGLGYALYYVTLNLPMLSGSESRLIMLFPYLVAFVWLAGAAAGYWLRRNRTELYDRVGGLIERV